MIVSCEQCETQFQLDDSKVPESGIRVRCSRCKHAFFVESPQRSDVERADDLAREALVRDAGAATRDRESNASGLEDGESDWQFNEEIDRSPVRDEGTEAAAREAVDDLLGGVLGGAPARSAEPVKSPEAASDSDLSDAASSVEIGGSSPGESIDLGGSDLGESVDPQDLDLDGSIDLDAARLGGSIDLGGSDLDVGSSPRPVATTADADRSLASESAEQPNAEAIVRVDAAEGVAPEEPFAASAPPEVELAARGTADTADALADRLTPLEEPEAPDLVLGDATPESSVSATPIGLLSPRISEDAAPLRADADDSAFDADTRAPASAWISRASRGVGWALVGLLFAYAGIVGLWPRNSVSETLVAARPVAGLEALDIRGRWIENAVAGPIYVVSGELRAATSAPLATGSVLRIRLLDDAGAPIRAESAAVGPLVATERLREWDLRDLRELQETRALRLAWSDPLAAGERRPFHAILGRVPAAAAAFEFQLAAAAGPAPDSGAVVPYLAANPAAEAMGE